MALTIYQLQPPPGGGFHFGEQGLELEESNVVFPSDSLFAALVATIAEQQGQEAVEEFVQPFTKGTPTFRLTSVFPRVGDLPLLPLPHLPIHTQAKAGREREELLPRKFTKRVRFVSPLICQKLCAGAEMDDYLSEKHGRFLQNGAIWLTDTEQRHLPQAWHNFAPAALAKQLVWQRSSVPRVTIDRVHSSSNIYLMGRVAFNQECGLWLGIETDEAFINEQIESLLLHLGDRGLGGERSNGYGSFTPKELTFDWPLADGDSSYRLLLSRFLPAPEEVGQALQDSQKPLIAYRLVTVGGWLTTPGLPHLRRKQISMLAEGSVVAGPVNGRMADVQPEWENFPHPVWRNGFALTLPVTAQPREDA